MSAPLMPKATAVWLVDNTALTFEQIADFCGLHRLEVQGIADGDVAAGIKGRDPVAAGEVDREEIRRCEADPSARLRMRTPKVELPKVKSKGPRYTPVSKRQEKPDAINWLVRYHPELSDAQISKLIGTTKTTIQAVRNKTHWNAANLKFVDPVSIGLCTQTELDQAVQTAREKLQKTSGETGAGATLLSAEESLREAESHEDGDTTEEELDAERLFNLPNS